MLEGNIPLGLHDCQRLEVISLAGTIPPSFGNTSSLESLGLEMNHIYGNIPTALAQLPNLKLIDLMLNYLTEYGSEGQVSTNGDIYSYGVMLLETFTRKKPTNETFSAEINLRQWVSASLPNKIMEIVDGGLLRMQNGSDTVTSQSILLAILELGLECTSDIPMERSDIKKVLVKLNKIKKQLLHIQSI
ncbi:putative LRR receptor-like serine/threonine-protein kinase [Camellia lanceoleosa]|uniref:LRR receptor-like serine/threonine-protein kinase n=1 Tax=Camellia lanceoleosa TaxID=1840588 RepID=A0ACC0I3S9_9ERIC|nr:putative LRR receptor-like serine/threonine-protein kinase [Camellia lanceoleosa]